VMCILKAGPSVGPNPVTGKGIRTTHPIGCFQTRTQRLAQPQTIYYRPVSIPLATRSNHSDAITAVDNTTTRHSDWFLQLAA